MTWISRERALVMRVPAALALGVSLAAPCHAAQSLLATQVDALPVVWTAVKRCGTWQAQGRQGDYRIIVGDAYDGAGSELYVQWIAQATQERPAAVIRTVAVTELNDDHNQFEIVSVDCQTRGRSTSVLARAINEHDEGRKRRAFAIRLHEAGGYTFEEVVRPARP